MGPLAAGAPFGCCELRIEASVFAVIRLTATVPAAPSELEETPAAPATEMIWPSASEVIVMPFGEVSVEPLMRAVVFVVMSLTLTAAPMPARPPKAPAPATEMMSAELSASTSSAASVTVTVALLMSELVVSVMFEITTEPAIATPFLRGAPAPPAAMAMICPSRRERI